MLAVLSEGVCHRLGRTPEQGPDAAGGREERPGLAALHREALRQGDAGPGLEAHVGGLPPDHLLVGVGEPPRGPDTGGVRLLQEHLHRQGGEGVARDDGDPRAELRPHGRPVPSLAVAVDDVVVQQRVVVHELDGHGTGQRILVVPADGSGREEDEPRAHVLAASREVVADGLVQRGVEPLDRRVEGRHHERGRAAECLGHLHDGCSTGARRDERRRHAGAASSSRVAGRSDPKDATAASAAASPERTAPSMVAGHPVAVHAPATNTPSRPVAGPLRSAAVPGLPRKVAACSRLTTASTSAASRASGNRSQMAAKKVRTSSSGRAPDQLVASERETTRHWLRLEGGTPAACVRSKTYWTGEDTAAANGRSVTRRSSTRWTLTIGARPRRATSPSVPSGRTDGAASCGRATTTASAPRTRPPVRTCTRAPPSPGASTESTAFPRRTSTPAAASACAPCAPCSRPSGTEDHPMSAPSRVSRSPVRNTLTASARDASAERTLTVGSTTRSQSRSTARSDWPCADSQRPKVVWSSAGSAGVRRPRARTARSRRRRSTSERWR